MDIEKPCRVKLLLVDDRENNLLSMESILWPDGYKIVRAASGKEALKILLARRRVVAAPRGIHFDAYRNLLVRTWQPWGWRGPMRRVVHRIARRQFARMRAQAAR